MELCHCHGGGRLLVDLLDAYDHGEPKIELCHLHGEGHCWSTCKMPMKMKSPRWSFAIFVDLVEEPI